MDGRKRKKTQAWYDAMAKRKGQGTNQYTKARSLGLPDPVESTETRKKKSDASKKQKHSDETKQKISLARRKYLEENPDKIPYKLNHYSNGRSYPEIYWKGILDSHGISYMEQYPVGMYSLDFAIIHLKIDLEIDGDQHYLDPRIVESDKRRTEYLSNLGWETIRVKWSDFQALTDKHSFVTSILQSLGPIAQ